MTETYRTGSVQEDFGTDPRVYRTGASSRSTETDPVGEARRSTQRNRYDENRKRRTADLFFEDSIVMLGILLGGTIGYIAASSVRKPDWSSGQTRRPSERGGLGRYFGQHGRANASRSVEKDETTDLIASNKVEGTAVYNHQGDKLGEVYNFMVGKRSGQVAYAVMSFGGFLGIGQKYHLLPWDVLTYDTGKKGYVVDADRERLMRAPSYAAGEEPFARPEYGQQVRDYWSSAT